MRSVVIIALLFIAFGTHVNAQAGRSADQRAEIKKEMDAFYEEIGVSEEQKLAIDEEQRRHGDEMRALRQKGSGRGMVEEREKIKETHTANMKEILSEEQFAEWEKKVKELQDQMRTQLKKQRKPN